MPSRLGLPSPGPWWFGVLNAEKNIPMSPPRCSDTKNFSLNPSLRIHYFDKSLDAVSLVPGRLELGAQNLGSKPRATSLASHSLIARFPTTTYNFKFRPAPPDAPGSGVACPNENSAPRSKR